MIFKRQVVALLIKKLFISLMSITVLLTALPIYPTANAVSEPNTSAYSAILINASTGEVLYSKNATDSRSMASTTKIMTAILAIESGKMQDEVQITADMVGAEGTSIGLVEDYAMTLETLVYGMLLESGNDAANAVAVFIGGSLEEFAVMMNEKAEQIGMVDSNFVTPSGLDDDEHYTTAYDMALLGAYAIANEQFCEICSTESIQMQYIEPEKYVTFTNHNSFLNYYDGAFGIKTGYTSKSGRCLVTAVEQDGVTLVAVTLNASDDWNDHIAMYDYGFEVTTSKDITVEFDESVSVYGSTKTQINVQLSQEVYTYYGMRISDEFEQKVYINNILYAPIEQGENLGYIELYYEGKLVEIVSILAAENAVSIEPIYEAKTGLFDWIKQIIKKWF